MNVTGMHYQVPKVWTAVKTALGAAALEGFRAIDMGALKEASRLEAENAACAWRTVWPKFSAAAQNYLWLGAPPDPDQAPVELDRLGQPKKKPKAPPMVRLERIIGLGGKNAFDSAIVLLDIMGTEDVAVQRMMKQIKGLPNSSKVDQKGRVVFEAADLRNITTNVLSELRNRVDAQGFLAARMSYYSSGFGADEQTRVMHLAEHGEYMTANRVKELATSEQERNSLMNFLSSWTNSPALVGRIIGEMMYPGVEPLAVRRARKANRVPVAWLMRWDEHYVEIQTEIARAAGAPKSPAQQAKIKRPLFSKHGKHYTFTEEAIQKHLDFLATWIEPLELIGDDAIDVAIRIKVGRGEPGDGRLIKKPVLFDSYSKKDDEGDESTDGDNEEQDQGDEDEDEDDDDDAALNDGESSPGKYQETDLIDIAPANWPPDATCPAYSASDTTQTTANDDPDKIRKRCLHKYPVLYQAGILLSISPATYKNELFATFLDMGVFTLINQVPNMKNVTISRLAACCTDDAGKALSTAAFTAKVKVMTIEFMTAARALMKANSRRESHDAD